MPREPHRPLRSVELHILLSVVDRPRHGYAILQEADERTDGRPGFEIPTLYRALQRLCNEGLIEVAEVRTPDDDERREYYQATDSGRAILRDELGRLKVAVEVGYARLSPLPPPPAAEAGGNS